MEENVFWIRLWALVISGIVVIGLAGFVFTYLGQRDLINAGFKRDTVRGYSAPTWIKE